MKTDEFITTAMNAGKEFLEQTDLSTPIRIVGHHDTDGLCATTLLQEALSVEGFQNITTTIYTHIQEKELKELQKIDEEILFFVDIGSSQADNISQTLSSKKIFILDHHKPSQEKAEGLTHINPFLSEVQEQKAISGAGVAYFFSLGMNKEHRALAHLAVLGALGDVQEKPSFSTLNNMIVQHAVVGKTIKVGKQLNLHGLYTKPLLKVLEHSNDLQLSGITGDFQGTLNLFRDLGIYYKFKDGRWKKYFHLFPDEKERLTQAIIDIKGEDDKDLFKPVYYFIKEPHKAFQDGKEFATIINACGRLEEYDIAIQALKGDEQAQQKARRLLGTYKFTIKKAFEYYNELQEQQELTENENIVVIHFEDQVQSSIVGVIASMLARNKHYAKGKIICTLAYAKDNTTKISLRASLDAPEVPLQDILQRVVEPFNATAGGHNNAAGASIPKDDEDECIQRLLKEAHQSR